MVILKGGQVGEKYLGWMHYCLTVLLMWEGKGKKQGEGKTNLTSLIPQNEATSKLKTKILNTETVAPPQAQRMANKELFVPIHC